jgi:hypothetical protein
MPLLSKAQALSHKEVIIRGEDTNFIDQRSNQKDWQNDFMVYEYLMPLCFDSN